ncbi:heavy-metal-associated domain-containing protein [Formosa maritima]|uniref:ATPase n=1 Tax=Formosa maritima TaxID=2592046 RepID=A0A5D0GGQ7_9FLAO|nr:heavy metal-associated domain-containing protein [Formosa maritima]TYA57961.1 ATPase [Formosa maritima]
MKKLGILLVMFVSMTAFSQNKNAVASIEVDGVCNMCKERIEKACIKTKGVKSATWNVETHELKLFYDENKTDLKTIQQNIAAVGHDTHDIKATDEAYNSVHDCCRYREESVVDDHKND